MRGVQADRVQLQITKLKTEQAEIEHILEVNIVKLVTLTRKIDKLKSILCKVRDAYTLTATEQKIWDAVQKFWRRRLNIPLSRRTSKVTRNTISKKTLVAAKTS